MVRWLCKMQGIRILRGSDGVRNKASWRWQVIREATVAFDEGKTDIWDCFYLH